MDRVREIAKDEMPYAADWNLVARVVNALLSAKGSDGISVDITPTGARFSVARKGQTLRLPVSAQIAAAYNSGETTLPVLSSAWLRARAANADGEHPPKEATGSESLDVRAVDWHSFGRVCVCLDSIEPGKTGRVIISGVAPVLVKADVDLVPALGDSDYDAKMQALAFADMVPDESYFQAAAVGYRLLWMDKPEDDDTPALGLIDLSQDHGQNAVVVHNAFGEEIPAYGAMRAVYLDLPTAPSFSKMQVTRPGADSDSNVVFNDLMAFPEDTYKRVPQTGAIVPVLLADGDSIPAGTECGTVDDKFYVEEGKFGLMSYGSTTRGGRDVVLLRPFRVDYFPRFHVVSIVPVGTFGSYENPVFSPALFTMAVEEMPADLPPQERYAFAASANGTKGTSSYSYVFSNASWLPDTELQSVTIRNKSKVIRGPTHLDYNDLGVYGHSYDVLHGYRVLGMRVCTEDEVLFDTYSDAIVPLSFDLVGPNSVRGSVREGYIWNGNNDPVGHYPFADGIQQAIDFRKSFSQGTKIKIEFKLYKQAASFDVPLSVRLVDARDYDNPILLGVQAAGSLTSVVGWQEFSVEIEIP